MSEKLVTIYKRKDGRLYLHGQQKSSMGVYIACPPFVKIEQSDTLRLPDAINELLAIEIETVPHPKIFNQLEPLYELADCRDWNEFAKGTLCFEISLEKGDIWLTRTKRDGAGFADLPDPVFLGKITELGSIFGTVPELA